MQDNGYLNPIEDTHRDILSEIAAGELDENYLIKHSADYGRRASALSFSVLRSFIGRLLRLRTYRVKPQPADVPTRVVSHYVSQR